ncbi:MAG: hypothetical protein LBL67_01720 [Coriobacteriales bacterium]|jgi:cell fate regulator YaaT (PSP1 superfamily)|nr:hypothetical protein [Coriobacteriales bacterium]
MSTTVVAATLKYNPKTFWFDGEGAEFAVGDRVLVETKFGREVATVRNPALEVAQSLIEALSSPLKPVVRKLDQVDLEHLGVLEEKGQKAMPVFHECIDKRGLKAKPVAVEYLFGEDKAVFYFAADKRIDFRELVRDLSSALHIGVNMRQISDRDEAAMVGGIGVCGQEICCRRLGAHLPNVSMKMAKEQGLSLNPSKTSGLCGKLMCCLRYEYDAYKDFNKRAPKVGSTIETPQGDAIVSSLDMPKELVMAKFEGESKPHKLRLEDLQCECNAEGRVCRCVASAEALEYQAKAVAVASGASLERFDSGIGDALGGHEVSVHRISGHRPAEEAGAGAKDKPKRRRHRRGGHGSGQRTQSAKGTQDTARAAAGGADTATNSQSGGAAHKSRRRRPRGQGGSHVQNNQNTQRQSKGNSQTATKPGRYSSALHAKPRRHHPGGAH